MLCVSPQRKKMGPEGKIASYAASLTLATMLPIVAKLSPLLRDASGLQLIGTAAGVVLASTGLYKLLYSSIVGLLRANRWVKQRILGPSFVEGTWVGHFTGREGDIRFIVEYFEQDLTGLVIRGSSYTDQGESHATWLAENCRVDPDAGTLIYTYTCDVRSRSVTLQGIGSFALRRHSRNAAPYEIEGYVADLVDGTRLHAKEIKVANYALESRAAVAKARQAVQ